jgi:hypothetical protein
MYVIGVHSRLKKAIRHVDSTKELTFRAIIQDIVGAR